MLTHTGPARKNDGSNAVIASYDHTNQTLMAFWSAASGGSGYRGSRRSTQHRQNGCPAGSA